MGNLFIKHESDGSYTDAETVYGCIMGDDFISNLDGVPPLKDFITFSSRLLDGKDILTVPVMDSRELTLQFVIFGDNASDFRTKKNNFISFLSTDPAVCVKVPDLLGNTVFHLVYTGKSVSYAESFSHTRAVISAKFIEPDPTNRN